MLQQELESMAVAYLEQDQEEEEEHERKQNGNGESTGKSVVLDGNSKVSHKVKRVDQAFLDVFTSREAAW